ncbi:hypothetical protein M758_3G181500 [Ceratodon purpureus]|uniref:Coiled-coil-helix-coiled-coil-helix domain containing 3 n=1 Tax=Ceratodon purpureus TaxID=3225 RepID=A0A8T0INM3_CERPU|nr:hypothetical protein KC19_3G181000 [Ceratodon purpureus]KAG0623538.1 hypothetical protein M758_3G181500 [Ceratodon purpureus]
MAPAQDAFSLQVTSELMQKLTKENIVAKEPAKGRKPTQKAAAPKPSMKPVEPAPMNLKQDLSLPYYPGFLSSLPGMNKPEVQTHEQTHDLVPIYKVLEETEKLGEKLQKQEEKELEKVKQLAQDLQDKQFRAPSYPIPCQTEKETCLQCYRGSTKSPLECAEAVRVFKECSQRVQQDFAQRTAAPQ